MIHFLYKNKRSFYNDDTFRVKFVTCEHNFIKQKFRVI